MSYDPAQLGTNAVYRIRLTLQDNQTDEFLQDAEIKYFLTKNNNNEDQATLEAAYAVLALLSTQARSREGQLEIYSAYDQYADFLDQLVKNLTANGMLAPVLVGGVRTSEVNRVDEDDESRDGGYDQDYLFDQTERTFGGGSIAAGTEFNNRDTNNTFRLRRP